MRPEVQLRDPARQVHPSGPDRQPAARHPRSARSPVGGRGDRPADPPRPTRREPIADPPRARGERGRPGAPLPAGGVPYPVTEVTRRWRRLLRDRSPGSTSWSCSTLRSASSRSTPTRCCIWGSCRTRPDAATGRPCWSSPVWRSSPGGKAEASLWVLVGNEAARAFYRSHRWTDTDDRRTVGVPAPPRGDADDPQEPGCSPAQPMTARSSRSAGIRTGRPPGARGCLLTVAGLALIPAVTATGAAHGAADRRSHGPDRRVHPVRVGGLPAGASCCLVDRLGPGPPPGRALLDHRSGADLDLRPRRLAGAALRRRRTTGRHRRVHPGQPQHAQRRGRSRPTVAPRPSRRTW